MKATDLLQKQHRDIEALLERLSAAGQADEQRIRQELAAILVAHTVIEEETFYPAVKEALPEEILEAIEEHGLAEVELARLLAADTGDDAADARTSVLTALVTRHIRREESEIFKAADRELGDEHLITMGEQMAQRFRQILDSGYLPFLRMALEQEVPRTTGPRRAIKKAARRGVAVKTAKTARQAAAKKPGPRSRRAPAKRATSKRGTAKRAVVTQRAPAKRAVAKRAVAKRAVAKRAVAKRPIAKHGTRKAAPAKRAEGKRTAAKRGLMGATRRAEPPASAQASRAPRRRASATRPRG